MEKEFRAQQILEVLMRRISSSYNISSYHFLKFIFWYLQAKRKRKEEAANARMLEAEKRMKVCVFQTKCIFYGLKLRRFVIDRYLWQWSSAVFLWHAHSQIAFKWKRCDILYYFDLTLTFMCPENAPVNQNPAAAIWWGNKRRKPSASPPLSIFLFGIFFAFRLSNGNIWVFIYFISVWRRRSCADSRLLF